MYYADLQPKEKIVVTHEGNSQTTLRFDETCPGKTPITPCNSPQKKQEWNNSFSTTKRVFYIIDGKNPFIFQRNHLQTCPKLLLNPVPCGSSYCVLDQDSKDITAYGVNIHSKWIEFKHNGYLDLGSSFLFQGSSLKREALVMGITFVAWVQPFQLIGKSQILLSLESTHHQIKISIQETSLSIFLSNFKLETIINPNQNLLELAQWAHIAVVMDATPLPTNPGTYTFFINGVQKTQIKTLHEGVSSFKRFPEKNEIHYEKAFIGAPYDASNLNYIPFQGQMSDIRLYSYPLTKERINEIWGGLEKPKQR